MFNLDYLHLKLDIINYRKSIGNFHEKLRLNKEKLR